MAYIRLRELIEEREEAYGRKITQFEVAQAAGINPSVLNRLYKGYIEQFTSETIDRLCACFGVTPDELFVVEAADVPSRLPMPERETA